MWTRVSLLSALNDGRMQIFFNLFPFHEVMESFKIPVSSFVKYLPRPDKANMYVCLYIL